MLLSTAAVYPGCLDGVGWQPFDGLPQPRPTVWHGLQAGQVAESSATGANASTILPSPQPRNYHFVAPSLLRSSINRVQAAQDQLLQFSNNHPDAFITHEVLLPLLLEDMSADSMRAARMLSGNCVAACTAPVKHAGNGQAQPQQLVFSCCGQIGEVLVLTTLTPVKPAGKEEYTMQAHTAAELRLGKEILQLDTQPVHDDDGWSQPCNPHGHMNGTGGVLAIARSSTRIDVIWAACTQTAQGHQQWCLEWRASLHTPVPASHVALHPQLAECAVLLQNGWLAVCSLTAAVAVPGQQLVAPVPLACTQLMAQQQVKQVLQDSGVAWQDNLTAHTVHMACTWGYHPRSIIVSIQGCLWQFDIRIGPDGQPSTQPKLIHQLFNGHTFIALATPPRMAMLPHRQHPASQKGASAVGAQATAQLLLQVSAVQPYLAALTSSQVLLLDLRRPHGWVLAAPHGCTTHTLTWLNFTCVPGSGHPDAKGTLHLASSTIDVAATSLMQYVSKHTLMHVNTLRKYLIATACAAHIQHLACLGLPHAAAGQQQHSQRRDASIRPAGGAAGECNVLGAHGRRTQALPQTGLLSSAPASNAAQQQSVAPCSALLTWGGPAGPVFAWVLSIQKGCTGLAMAPIRPTGRVSGSSKQTSHQLHVLLQRPNPSTSQLNQHHSASTGNAHSSVVGIDAAGYSGSSVMRSWHPACMDVVQAVRGVQQVCNADSLSADPRLRVLQDSRTTLHSTAARTHGSASTSARQWGNQGDADVQRACHMQEYLEAVRGAPDSTGMTVLPLVDVQQPQGGFLLLRANYDGDLCIQHLTCHGAAHRQATASGSMQAACSGAGAESMLQALQTQTISRQPASQATDDVHHQLFDRYASGRHAARAIMGNQAQGLRMSRKLPCLHKHLHLLLHRCLSCPTSALQQASRQEARQLQMATRVHKWHAKAAAATGYVQYQVFVLHTTRPDTVAAGSAHGPAEASLTTAVEAAQQHMQDHWLPWLRRLLVAMHVPLTVGDVLLRTSPTCLPAPSQPDKQKQPVTTAFDTPLVHSAVRGRSHVEQLMKTRLVSISQLLQRWSQMAVNDGSKSKGSTQTSQNAGLHHASEPYWIGSLLSWAYSQQGQQLMQQLPVHAGTAAAAAAAVPVSGQASQQQQCEHGSIPQHILLISGIAVRQPAASATAGIAQAGPSFCASTASHSVLQAHLQVVLPINQLHPHTSRMIRYEGAAYPASPVLQRAAQVKSRQQAGGTWQVAMSDAALRCYHKLLDAWPESDVTGQAQSGSDMWLFARGYQQPGTAADAEDAQLPPGRVLPDNQRAAVGAVATRDTTTHALLQGSQPGAAHASTKAASLPAPRTGTVAAGQAAATASPRARKRKLTSQTEGF